jgi:ubiquinone/menaquinone biosynthesis C-methylase UbiE
MDDNNNDTISFSRTAGSYDQTRVIPEAVLAEAVGLIRLHCPLPPVSKILDVGCGTGQFTYAFVREGGDAAGIDISPDMIKAARSKSGRGKSPEFVVMDARRLQFADGSFDLVVSSKLFLHIRDWQKAADEILRVAKPGGYFVYLNELGYFSNAVRVAFRKFADGRGYTNRFLGEPDLEKIKTYFLGRGCEYRVLASSDLSWKREITCREAFTEIKNKSFAEFWGIPEGDYRAMLEETERWIAGQPGGWETTERLSPWLRIDAYKMKGDGERNRR